MKTIHFFKATLAVLVLSLTIGFGSCSSDDNDSEPGNPTTIKLPTIIEGTYIEEDETSTYKYEFEYNDNNQITSVKRTNDSKTRTHTISYNDKGQPVKTVYQSGNDNYTYNYTYDETKGIVTISNVGSPYSDYFYIDKNGYPTSNKDEYSQETYEYNKDFDLTKLSYIYKYTREEDGTSILEERRYDDTFTYSTVYSPYINIKIPAWFIYVEEADMPFDTVLGKHLPSKIEYTKKEFINGVENTEESYTDVTTITIQKDGDNYPTEISSESVYSSGEKENSVFTIKYKTIKVK